MLNIRREYDYYYRKCSDSRTAALLVLAEVLQEKLNFPKEDKFINPQDPYHPFKKNTNNQQ